MTPEQIIELADRLGLFTYYTRSSDILAFANLIASETREECARICETLDADKIYTADRAGIIGAAHAACAAAIRKGVK